MSDFLNRGLPKWPQMVVTGERIREDQALEIIRRTDRWFIHGYGGNDREGSRKIAARFRMPHFLDDKTPSDWRAHGDRCDRWAKAWGIVDTEYVANRWVGTGYIHGPHGWCHPDGTISYVDNVGKWPSIEDIYNDWQRLAVAFPFLNLTATLMNGEECESFREPVVSIKVAEGTATLAEPESLAGAIPSRGPDLPALLGVVLLDPARRERYPFREDVLQAWERKAIAVDEEISQQVQE